MIPFILYREVILEKLILFIAECWSNRQKVHQALMKLLYLFGLFRYFQTQYAVFLQECRVFFN